MPESNLNNYELSKDEYVHSLEIAVQLLQREVDSLRSENIRNNSSPHNLLSSESMLHSFRDLKSINEVINSLYNAIKTSFDILESNIYIINEDSYHREIIDSGTSSILNQQIKIIEEQGIIDMVINNQKADIIPNNTNQDEFNSHFILIPLFLREIYQGIFIAKTNKSKKDYTEIDLNTLSSLSESALYVIDNIKSADEIKKMNQRLNNLNKELSKNSFSSIDDLSSLIFKEIDTSMEIIGANAKFIASGIGEQKVRCKIITDEISKVKTIKNKILNSNGINNFNLIDLIDRVLSISNSQLRRDGIRVENNITLTNITLNLNQVQLEQALLKILLFSRDSFYEEGTININLFDTLNSYHLMITDDSNGVDENELKNLFDPINDSNMYILKNILNELNIRFELNSEFGKGNTFKLYFNK